MSQLTNRGKHTTIRRPMQKLFPLEVIAALRSRHLCRMRAYLTAEVQIQLCADQRGQQQRGPLGTLGHGSRTLVNQLQIIGQGGSVEKPET